LVAKAEKETDRLALEEKADKLKKKASSWAACLARVFDIFPLICPKCNLEIKPVAVILNDKELVRLLGFRRQVVDPWTGALAVGRARARA